jgi:hypothetical protein
MQQWIDKLSNLHTVTFLISIDDDDWSMHTPLATMTLYPDTSDRTEVRYFTGKHTNKIEAINRDMEHAGDFDILIVVSDDMVPQVQGYDEIIVNDMAKYFPDGLGALHYNDGHANHQLCTLSIMTKQMYDHFGYIYNPEYHEMWCDNEFMDVCNEMGKMQYIDNVIVEHQYKRHGTDDNYKRGDSKYQDDRRTYLYRKENGWPK